MKTESYELTYQEHATVLAALRYYEEQGLADDPLLRPDDIHKIAIGGGDTDFIASLDGCGVDELCERLNFSMGRITASKGEPLTTPLPTNPASAQLYAPNGKRIVAAKDWIPANALIEGASRNPDGSFEIEWAGESKICWDGQQTEEDDGERIFLDEGGDEWPENQLTLKD